MGIPLQSPPAVFERTDARCKTVACRLAPSRFPTPAGCHTRAKRVPALSCVRRLPVVACLLLTALLLTACEFKDDPGYCPRPPCPPQYDAASPDADASQAASADAVSSEGGDGARGTAGTGGVTGDGASSGSTAGGTGDTGGTVPADAQVDAPCDSAAACGQICSAHADCDGAACHPDTKLCVPCIAAIDGDHVDAGNPTDGGEFADAGSATDASGTRADNANRPQHAGCDSDTPLCKTDPDEPANNQCVECLGDGDCTGACDPNTNACIQCAAKQTKGCLPEAPLCEIDADDAANNRCVQCLQAAHCDTPANPRCDEGACSGCERDADCERFTVAATLVCNTSDNACVQCTSGSEHCRNPEPICDAANKSCRACTDSPECALRDPALPACDENSCVQCVDASQCAGTEPICDRDPDNNVEDNTCRACQAHAECVSAGAVLCNSETGACLSQGDVIYVDDDTCDSTGEGTQANPYCSLQSGVDAVEEGRTAIWVAPGAYAPVSITGAPPGEALRTVWIAGQDGAEVTATLADDPNISLSGRVHATLDGLLIRDNGSTGVGIECVGTSTVHPTLIVRDSTIQDNDGGALVATNCSVTLDRNTITGNAGGGIRLSSCDFTVTNNIVAANGPASTFGGVYIAVPGDPAVFNSNTVADNLTSGGDVPGGIRCVDPVELRNTIVSGHSPKEDISDRCVPHFCHIEDETGDASGTNNQGGEPALLIDYHLQTESPPSPCVDAADPATAPHRDIDGEPRPQGDAPDIGADEAA